MAKNTAIKEVDKQPKPFGKRKEKRPKYTLDKVLPLLSEETLNVAHGLIDDAIFMEKKLEELRQEINENGVAERNQYGTRQTAAVSTYLQMQKQYGVTIGRLIDLVPRTDRTSANVSLLDWVDNN